MHQSADINMRTIYFFHISCWNLRKKLKILQYQRFSPISCLYLELFGITNGLKFNISPELQYCAKLLRHPSLLYVLLPRNQTDILVIF